MVAMVVVCAMRPWLTATIALERICVQGTFLVSTAWSRDLWDLFRIRSLLLMAGRSAQAQACPIWFSALTSQDCMIP